MPFLANFSLQIALNALASGTAPKSVCPLNLKFYFAHRLKLNLDPPLTGLIYCYVSSTFPTSFVMILFFLFLAAFSIILNKSLGFYTNIGNIMMQIKLKYITKKPCFFLRLHFGSDLNLSRQFFFHKEHTHT